MACEKAWPFTCVHLNNKKRHFVPHGGIETSFVLLSAPTIFKHNGRKIFRKRAAGPSVSCSNISTRLKDCCSTYNNTRYEFISWDDVFRIQLLTVVVLHVRCCLVQIWGRNTSKIGNAGTQHTEALGQKNVFFLSTCQKSLKFTMLSNYTYTFYRHIKTIVIVFL